MSKYKVRIEITYSGVEAPNANSAKEDIKRIIKDRCNNSLDTFLDNSLEVWVRK